MNYFQVIVLVKSNDAMQTRTTSVKVAISGDGKDFNTVLMRWKIVEDPSVSQLKLKCVKIKVKFL